VLIFLGINLYDFISRVISVKILFDEFISLENKSVVGVGGGKKETERE
jgi:hypothetical protein